MRLNSSFVRGSKLGFQHSSLNSLHDSCQRKQRLNLLLKLVNHISELLNFVHLFCDFYSSFSFVHFVYFQFSILSIFHFCTIFNCVQYLHKNLVQFSILSMSRAHMKISILFYYSDILVIENERILEINKSCKLNLAEKRKGRLESD